MSSDKKSEYSLYILKKDILKIPCFKQTMFYSLSSWIGIGLLTFLFTSKPRLSSHCGFASYVIVTFGYFTHCRIKYKKKEILSDQLKEIVHKSNVLEGTYNNEENKLDIPALEDM